MKQICPTQSQRKRIADCKLKSNKRICLFPLERILIIYFSSKWKCSYMRKSWWWKQLLLNFTAHVYFCSAVYFNSPCFQCVLWNKRSTIREISIGLNFSFTRYDEKSDFLPWKWGSTYLYTNEFDLWCTGKYSNCITCFDRTIELDASGLECQF